MRGYAAAFAALLLTSTSANAYVLLEGPMPALGVSKAPPAVNLSGGFKPAPRFDLDAQAPVVRGPNGPVIGPGLINRNVNRKPVGNGYVEGGSSYSDQLERRGRTATAIGNTLAPAITITTPLSK